VEKWIILVFVLGLLVIFWRTRPRPRLPTPKVDPGFYDLFQARAVEVGREVFRSALRRLDHAETDSARVRRAAEALAAKLAELRTSEGESTERVAAEWEYLGACYASRYPALHRLVESADLPGLERLARAEPEALGELVTEEIRALGRELEEGLALLAQDPAAIWGDLELVVLTLVVRQCTPDEEIAAALRAGRYAKRGPASHGWRARRELAWNLVHSTPPAERRTHDGAPALVTEDPELGAAFVRFHVNEVAQKSELERARALVGGEVELLWLGQEIAGALAYPEPSLDAWRNLAPLGRRALPEDDQARSELLAEARTRLGETGAERVGARLASEVARFG
jgi:hypothetical protein